jgi:hypothetical protein
MANALDRVQVTHAEVAEGVAHMAAIGSAGGFRSYLVSAIEAAIDSTLTWYNIETRTPARDNEGEAARAGVRGLAKAFPGLVYVMLAEKRQVMWMLQLFTVVPERVVPSMNEQLRDITDGITISTAAMDWAKAWFNKNHENSAWEENLERAIFKADLDNMRKLFNGFPALIFYVRSYQSGMPNALKEFPRVVVEDLPRVYADNLPDGTFGEH